MTGRGHTAAVGVGTWALLLGGCGGEPATQFRQRITVEVETPEGVRRGSAVVEVGNQPKSDFLKAIPGNGYSVRGEAVAVDIAPGKTLFALLSAPNAKWGDTNWYQAELIGNAIRQGAGAGSPVTLPPQLYPLLVTFANLADAKTVVEVDPDDLAATFGKGVTLTRITVERTNAAVTSGIGKRLATLGLQRDHGLDPVAGVSAKPTLAQQLGYSDFSRGVE